MNNKNVVSLALIVIFLASILFFITKPVNNSRVQDSSSTTKLTQLSSETLVEGTGDRVVKVGDTIRVHYTGTLLNGTKFDSSKDRNQPFEFTVGEGVILGWSQGVQGMKKGQVVKLSIPSDLAYGSQAVGSIPANSDLYFEIELLDFLN